MIYEKLHELFWTTCKVQQIPATDLFLSFGLERNSAASSLLMSSLYLNPASPVSVKVSEQKVIP